MNAQVRWINIQQYKLYKYFLLYAGYVMLDSKARVYFLKTFHSQTCNDVANHHINHLSFEINFSKCVVDFETLIKQIMLFIPIRSKHDISQFASITLFYCTIRKTHFQ